MRDDEDTPSRRQHVAYDVRDGVGFSSTRRALHHETIRLFEAADDLNLFVVERLGEK